MHYVIKCIPNRQKGRKKKKLHQRELIVFMHYLVEGYFWVLSDLILCCLLEIKQVYKDKMSNNSEGLICSAGHPALCCSFGESDGSFISFKSERKE
jgi:hypothetical protein